MLEALRFHSCEKPIQGPVDNMPEKPDNSVAIVKTHQMFSSTLRRKKNWIILDLI